MEKKNKQSLVKDVHFEDMTTQHAQKVRIQVGHNYNDIVQASKKSLIKDSLVRIQELCESRGGRPGWEPSLINLWFPWT